MGALNYYKCNTLDQPGPSTIVNTIGICAKTIDIYIKTIENYAKTIEIY
jgi:hypothetical protein